MDNLQAKQKWSKVKGFNLVELMIAMVIGLVLFAGVMSIFVGMRTTTAETSSYGELQENGRFAISVLTNDLLNQNFWGDFVGEVNTNSFVVPATQPTNDCVGGGVNNATFPQDNGSYRTIWGQTIQANALDPLGCFVMPANTQTMVDSDVIQFKRVIASPVTALRQGNYYLTTNSAEGAIFKEGATVPVIENSRLWEYQHHVYYVRQDIVGNNTVPVLMQGRLQNGQLNFTPVIDGIERIRFMYGIDTTAEPSSASYGVVDAFIPANTMPDSFWDNSSDSRILAVKVFVLAREIQPDLTYQNTNTYNLGGVSFTPNDNFRRLLFSSTITLYNNEIRAWMN